MTSADPSRELLTADDDQRAQWVARQRPTDRDDQENWWLHLLLVITHHARAEPAERAGWARVFRWAVRDAVATGALAEPEAARRTSTFVVGLRRLGVTGDLDGALPSADEVVEDCLRHVPNAPRDLPALPARGGSPLTEADLELVRRARRAKTLVTSAAPHLDEVRDPALVDRLSGWIAALPRLG